MTNEAGSISGGIHFTGLGSGTDFDTMIESLIDVESLQKKRMENWKATWELKIEGFHEVNTRLLSLKTTLQKMDTPSEFITKTASVANETEGVLSASSSADALEGTYDVSIQQLAKNDVFLNSETVTDPVYGKLSSNATTFGYTYASNATSINVPANTSLNTLINLINADPNNPGVRAEKVQISDGEYSLKLVGLDLGEDNQITNFTGSLSGYGSNASYSEVQNAQNAKLVVDNVAIERSTNTVEDAVEGVTLTLKASNASTRFTVATDKEAIKENVREFVTTMNDVRAAIKELTNVDDSGSDQAQGSLLTGNYGVDMIAQNLKNIVAARGLGFDPNSDSYTALSQLGITTDANTGSATAGLLLLDEEILDEALSDDIEAVSKLFAAKHEGTTNSTDFVFSSALDSATAGIYDVSYTINGSGQVTGSIGGHPASYDSTTQQLTSLEGPAAGLAILVNNTTAGSYSGEVRLMDGKAKELVDELNELTNDKTGTLAVLEDNYKDIINNIDKKIEREETRLASREQHLREQFARLERTLSNYSGINATLTSSLNSLPSS